MLTESSNLKPINAYGASKLAVENILENFATSSGLSYAIFRYFNVAGADPYGEIGEYHLPETHLIPLIFDAILEKRKHFKVFGNNYSTHDGTCVRDYIHV